MPVNAQELLARVRDQARQRPVLFVGGALGAGLLAGGAVPARVLGRLAALAGALAWRTVVLPMIKERVFAALEPRSDQPVGGRDEAERFRQRQHP
jgi:hypothetical protein